MLTGIVTGRVVLGGAVLARTTWRTQSKNTNLTQLIEMSLNATLETSSCTTGQKSPLFCTKHYQECKLVS